MNIAKCLNRHYYDKDKFFECPTCKKNHFSTHARTKPVVDETQVLDDEDTIQIESHTHDESPTVVMDENVEVTSILEEEKTQILDDNK